MRTRPNLVVEREAVGKRRARTIRLTEVEEHGDLECRDGVQRRVVQTVGRQHDQACGEGKYESAGVIEFSSVYIYIVTVHVTTPNEEISETAAHAPM